METFYDECGIIWYLQVTALSETTNTNTKRSRRKKVNFLAFCYQVLSPIADLSDFAY